MTFELPPCDEVIAAALAEDLGVEASRLLRPTADNHLLDRDVTSAAVVPAHARFSGRIVAREDGVVCGLPVVARLYEMLASPPDSKVVDCFPLVAEGAAVVAGTAVMELDGPARTILAGERAALDFLMVLSGIATEARRWQQAAGEALAVADTRKTLPGLRALSKYAVRVGGAANHRTGLFDMVLIKDNHIAHAGGVAAAVSAAAEANPDLLIACEADTFAQAVEAARAGARMVMLDNMDDAALAEAVAAVREVCSDRGRPCLTEASGGIEFERLSALARSGVDRVSTSAITLAPPVDFALDAD